MTRFGITVTDPSLAQQVGEGIIVGRAFAFLPADLLARPALRWIQTLVPATAMRPRVVSLLSRVELPGLYIEPAARPALATAVVTSDKVVYREGADAVHLLACDPLGGGRELELEITLSGQPFARRAVKLSARGAGALALRDLPVGDYKIRVRGAPAADPPCAFTVATYRLSPLVARLAGRRAAGDQLTLEVGLVAFGVPVSGPVQVELLDAGTRIARTQVTATAGTLEVTLALRGEGPHTVNFQLANDPGRTATIPLVGSRAAERRDTVFSTLGAEILGSALPSDDATEVRGLYLRRGGTSTSPVRLDRVDTRVPMLTAMTDLDTVTIAIVDPSLARVAGAVDPNVVQHPALEDELYRHGEQLFVAGDYAAALETFVGARGRLDKPHPNYAYFIACSHARMGDRAAALAALRTAIREGWNDFAHLRGDDDLAALRDDPGFAVVAGGGVRIVETSLRRGESVTLDVPSPLAYLAIGAFAAGAPWEGHAAIVAPATVASRVEVEVEATVAPSSEVAIAVRTGGADASVYVIVKDARLLSADTPASRLAAQLKANVDATRDGQVFGLGVARDALSSLLPPVHFAPPQQPHQGMYVGPPRMPAGMLEVCHRCGKENQPHYKFCLGCGFELPVAVAPPPHAQMMRTMMVGVGAPRGGPPLAGRVPNAPMGMPMGMPMPVQSAVPVARDHDDDDTAPSAAAYYEGDALSARSPVVAQSMARPAPPPSLGRVPAPSPSRSPQVVASAPPPPRAAIADEPEVVFAGIVTTHGGHAAITVQLGSAFADYLVEAFAIDNVEWSATTARFRAERTVFAELQLPAFVHRDDTAVGRVTIGGGAAGMTIAVACDGASVPLSIAGLPYVAGTTLPGPRAELDFVAGPGDYTATLVDVATGETVVANARVDEPGKLRRVARSVRLLAPSERIARRDDASILSLRTLPGLDRPFSVLCDATADYGHACCEQTAAKMLAACAMYLFAGDDAHRRARAEDIVIAGVRRERSMFLPGQGFKMYPDSANRVDTHWGPLTARYLWNLELLRGPAASRALTAALDDSLDMAKLSTGAYKLEWPPRNPRTANDAYGALRFNADAKAKEQALGVLRGWVEANARARRGGAVQFRADAAYTAAGLFRAGGPTALPAALGLANRVVGDLGAEGRLYSTVDSVAAIALMTELQAAGIVQRGGGAPAFADDAEIHAGASTVAVEVTRIIEDDWDRFAASVPITVTLRANGRPSARVVAGDPVELVVRLDGAYEPGDLVWVALPDALSRVIGGGQVKRFSVDLAGASEVTIPLAATALTVDRDGREAPQRFAVCVRNMFEEERAGTVGPLDITVRAPA